jgi:hypothetical protein
MPGLGVDRKGVLGMVLFDDDPERGRSSLGGLWLEQLFCYGCYANS